MHRHRLGLAAQGQLPGRLEGEAMHATRARVEAATRMVPGGATSSRREAVFTVSPVTS